MNKEYWMAPASFGVQLRRDFSHGAGIHRWPSTRAFSVRDACWPNRYSFFSLELVQMPVRCHGKAKHVVRQFHCYTTQARQFVIFDTMMYAVILSLLLTPPKTNIMRFFLDNFCTSVSSIVCNPATFHHASILWLRKLLTIFFCKHVNNKNFFLIVSRYHTMTTSFAPLCCHGIKKIDTLIKYLLKIQNFFSNISRVVSILSTLSLSLFFPSRLNHVVSYYIIKLLTKDNSVIDTRHMAR